MSAAERDGAETGSAGLVLEPSRCCLCGVDDAEPVGVGEDFEYRTSPDTFLAVRCRRCGMIYLNPRPTLDQAPRIYPDHYHAFVFQPENFGLAYRVRSRLEARRALAWCRGLPDDAHILDVGCGDGFHLSLLRTHGAPGWTLEGVDNDARAVSAARKAGLTVHHGSVQELGLPERRFHLILMIMTIEHLNDPVQVLRSVGRLLVPGGRVVIVTDNAASPDFGLFGGRHWGGYHFPRHPNLFTQQTLAKLAAAAELEVVQVGTTFSPVNWVYSIRNWLQDWGAPRALSEFFSLKSAPALAVFTVMDLPLAMLGRGAILRATFRRATGEGGGAS